MNKEKVFYSFMIFLSIINFINSLAAKNISGILGWLAAVCWLAVLLTKN